MKKNKLLPLIILTGVLLLLIAAYLMLDAYNERKADESASAETEETSIPVFDLSLDNAEALSYKTDKLDMSLVKTGAEWMLADDEKFPVDQSVVGKMLKVLTNLSASRKLAGSDGTAYGTDKPSLTVTLTVNGEDHVLSLGSVNSYNDMTYLGYGSDIYVISDTLTDAFDADKTELFAVKDSFPKAITADSVKTINVVNAKGDSATVTDEGGLEELVSELTKYISFAIPKGYGLDADGLAEYGITEDCAKITVEYENDSAKATFELLLGKDSDGKCYYALPKGDVTYGIDVEGCDKLLSFAYHTAEETN